MRSRKLTAAIALMDERGRSNPEDNSVMLWDREWAELRALILAAGRDWDRLTDEPPVTQGDG